jgi:hypothetical protein
MNAETVLALASVNKLAQVIASTPPEDDDLWAFVTDAFLAARIATWAAEHRKTRDLLRQIRKERNE